MYQSPVVLPIEDTCNYREDLGMFPANWREILTRKETKHRGNNRAWLEPCEALTKAGFIAGAPYDITYDEERVILRLNPEGKRAVTKGSRAGVIDVSNKKMNQYNFARGIHWIISAGLIYIQPVSLSEDLTS
tara:strand:+ start:1020 stop:1415 length:396 start_codon:yes stop_codon:yes gene_type:complete